MKAKNVKYVLIGDR